MEIFLFLILTSTSAVSANMLTIDKGVIVHLFEWRWADVARECVDFLAPYGFAGVQISPPSENIIIDDPPRPWWERYQPISYKLTTRSGTEKELQDMLNTCNKVGIRIFADVVLNHMTGPSKIAVGTGGSTADPLNYNYPAVPYSKSDFHQPPCGVDDYNNATQVRNCELTGLRDLDQSKSYVRRKELEYLNKLIGMGFAGFRVDAAKHMWSTDLKYMFDRLEDLDTEHGFPPNTRPLIYMEVIDYNGDEAVKWQQYSSLGMVTDFRYGSALGEAFIGKRDLVSLKNFASTGNLLPDDIGIVFVDNHDTQRGSNTNILNYKTFRPYKMALAFMLAYPWGTPNVLSSYYFDTYDQGPPHDSQNRILSPQPTRGNICTNKWVCEHRWRQVYNMVHFHKVVAGTDVTNWWDNGKNQIAFCRGKKGFLALNREAFKLSRKLQTCLPKGKYCDVISGNLVNNTCTGKVVEVGEDGLGRIEINPFDLFDTNVENDGVLALHIKAKVEDKPLGTSAGENPLEEYDPSGAGSQQVNANHNPTAGNQENSLGINKQPSPVDCDHCNTIGGNKNPLTESLSSGSSGESVPAASGTGSPCEKLLNILSFSGRFSGGSVPAATGTGSPCDRLFNLLSSSGRSSGGSVPAYGTGSPCEKLLDLLSSSDGSSGLSSLLAPEIDNLALLNSIIKVRKMQKILELLKLTEN